MSTSTAAPAMQSRPLVMINLGSGLQRAPGWINYDRSRSAIIARNPVLAGAVRAAHRAGLVKKAAPLDWPRETRVHDLLKGIPHETGSVDIVYSSHFWEHLPREAGVFLTRESFRVLRPGGWMRLVVPDLETLARAYVDGDREYFRNDEPTIADAFMASLRMGASRTGPPPLRRVARGLLKSDEGGHRWMYDTESVTHLMREAGFADIEPAAFREGRCTEGAAIDTQERSTVYVEGRKPAA